MHPNGSRKRSTRLAAAALSATGLVSIIIFGGAWNWSGYSGRPLFSSSSLVYGALFFAIPLLTILWTHELGHILVAKRHGVRLSPPILLPSAPPLGTLGALMFVRGEFPNRRSLIEIGMAGPITGFVASLFVTILGLSLSETSPMLMILPGQEFQVPGSSMAFAMLQGLFPITHNRALHPTAFAGWAGFLATAISLLPVGQLDGGHIFKAAFGRWFRFVSVGTVLLLLGLGVIYYGWALLGLLLLPFGLAGPKLPDDSPEIDRGRAIGVTVAAILLLLTFVPQPLAVQTSPWDLRFESALGERLTVHEVAVPVSASAGMPLVVRNTGREMALIDLGVRASRLESLGFAINFVRFVVGNESHELYSTSAALSLRSSEGVIVHILIETPRTIPSPDTVFDFEITARVSALEFIWTLPVIVRLTTS